MRTSPEVPVTVVRQERFGRPIPTRAIFLSIAALIVPVAGQLYFAEGILDYEVLLWLLALVPAFLLAYYRGWSGVATALATGMAVLAVSQAVLTAIGHRIENWPLLLAVVLAYLAISLAIGVMTELLHRERDRAERLALLDDLTGLPNRRLIRQFLDIEVAAAQRGRQVCLVIFDLDNFKKYNDKYGHPAGDRAIAAMGHALIKNTRRMNMSARWGGEEFVSVISDNTAPGAMVFVERVQQTLRSQGLEGGPLTFSAGLAEYGGGIASADDLLAAADEALDEAKAKGRDRTVIYQGTPSQQPSESSRES